MFDAESLIKYGGLLIVVLAVYGQTGLFFCFFLPSGALMFTTGVFVSSGSLDYNIGTVCGALVAAALAGNITGYWFGRKTGPLLYNRDSKFFKQKHLQAAENFYTKYEGLALAAGPFFPIIRTFSPIVAGMIKVNFRRFLLFTFLGCMAWILSFVMTGYLIGSMPFLKPYLKYIIMAIVILVTIPIVIKVVREFKKAGINTKV